MKNNPEYRFKAYQFQTEDGWSWMIEYPDIPACVGGGETIEEAIKEGNENIKEYLEYLKEENKPIPKPTIEPRLEGYSGKLVLRLSKSNHKKLSEVAEKEGVSINALLNEMISEGLQERLSQKATSEVINELRDKIIISNNLSLNLKHN